MMFWFYQIFISIYTAALRIAALFNPKARLWVTGRKNLLSRIKGEVVTTDPLVWFHCASLGEFEQGRPVMEAIKKEYPGVKIILTFFSPSGYEVRKNYHGADWVYYLPPDTIYNARQLVRHLNPVLVFFVKYEFWFNYLDALYRRKVPILFLSVIFRPSQYFFRWWGAWFRRQFQKITYFFVQDEQSADLLDQIGVHHAEVAGDTRFDRVLSLVQHSQKFEQVELFKQQSLLLVGGSTWPVDEQMLLELMEKAPSDVRLLLAPHLVDDAHIASVRQKFSAFNPVLFTQIGEELPNNCRVLIVNTIGKLAQLYQYADMAYVGGGFGVGIHNLPEVAVYGIPVVFGPNHQKFKEAIDLKNLQGGFAVSSEKEGVEIILELLNNSSERISAGEKAKKYIVGHAGATYMVMDKAATYLSRNTKSSL